MNFFLLLVLLLLMLWLLEEVYAITLLPTNNTRIGKIGKNEIKQGMTNLEVGFKVFFFLSFSHAQRHKKRWLKTLKVAK